MSSNFAVAERTGAYWDQYLPTEPPVYRITDIDIERWVAQGVTTLLLDAEANLGVTGEAELEPDNIAWVEDTRRKGIEHVGLFSNFNPHDVSERELLAGWGDQIGAERVFAALEPQRRKPSQYMILQAKNFFEVDQTQIGIVDDKVTAGIRAGRFAGVKHLGWTRPFGENRHIGDRLIRNPFEAIMRIRAHLLLTPTFREMLDAQTAQALLDSPLDAVAELFQSGQVPDGKDKIVGLGVEDIPLTVEQLTLLKEPAYRQAMNVIKSTLDYYGEKPAEKLRAYLHEHGRTTADWLTYSRLAIAGGLIAVHMSDIDMETKRKISAGMAVIGIATDAADGYSARAHKDGATKKGGAEDQNIDHILSAVTDVFSLLPLRSIDKLDAVVPIARDIGMTMLRKPFKQRGIDTKSIASGKIGTGLLGGSQLFDLTVGSKFPGISKAMRRAALVAKVGSMAQAPFAWIEQHEINQHEANKLRRASGLIVAQALEL